MAEIDSDLRWVFAGFGVAYALCGDELQGIVTARLDDDGTGATWSLDMLPGDAEPTIRGRAGTFAEAKAAATHQVAEWPALIKGATRNG